MDPKDEAVVLLFRLQDIDARYPLLNNSEKIQQLKLLVIENALLTFANYSVNKSLRDDD